MASYIPEFVHDNVLLTATVATIATSTVLPFLNFVYSNIRTSSLPRYRHGDQSWALVTGASDGIGYGFVAQLAEEGFNVTLHGRNKSKLDGLVSKLQQQYPARHFRTLVVSASDRSTWRQLDEFAGSVREEKLNLTVLVNNVGGGIGGHTFSRLEERTLEDIHAFVDINANFPAQITRSLLPILKANQPSLVLNMGSFAGLMGLPYLGLYCGGKAFDNIWSQALRLEMICEKEDIEVLSLTVGKVQSAGTKMLDTSLFVPTSKQFAQSALQKVGCGVGSIISYWPHAVQFWSMTSVPTWLKEKIFMDVSTSEMKLERKAA